MRFFYFILFFSILSFAGQGQPFVRVAHCPSNEVYDMLVDKKGFIWIADNLGVSRYDGISFTSFSSLEETSISMTDLVEDNYGRIWCHNFNGQIFYIQNDKMFFLKGFDFKNERTFPRMMLFGNELVATCRRGLFVCNTATLECRYLSVGDNDHMLGKETESLCVIHSTLLVFGYGYWYTYKNLDGLQRIGKRDVGWPITERNGLLLEPGVFGDTAFVIDRDNDIVYGITLANNKITTVLKKPTNSYINGVNIEKDKIFINTKTVSFSLDGLDSLGGYNLSSIVYDKEGNTWLGSLSTGLFVSYKTSEWKPMSSTVGTKKDYVKLLNKTSNYFISGSQSGLITIMASPMPNLRKSSYVVPVSDGAIESILPAGGDGYFICASKELFVLKVNTKKLFPVDKFFAKDIILYGKVAYAATAGGILIKDLSALGFRGGDDFFQKNFPPGSIVPNKDFFLYTREIGRCRALLFDTATGSLLASFKDGLQQIKDGRISPVLYKGKPIYVSSMIHFRGKIYAATFNDGLFVIEAGRVKRIDEIVESPMDAIVRIKRCNNHIWLFKTHDIEVLDAVKDSFINIYPFPVDVSSISDVEEDGQNTYIVTDEGLYNVPHSANTNLAKTDPVLLYMLINNKDTVYNTGVSLPANKNNLLLKMAIPVYKNATQVHFKYHLINDNDNGGDTWYYTQDAQRELQFNALKSGSYTIEVLAVINNRVLSNTPLIYKFSITKPWYLTGWFYLVMIVFAISMSMVIYQYRLYQLVKMERMRRKISNDLHDDIGSTLSSINVYSQLAKSDRENIGYIDNIQSNTVTIINNLDDLVWNINPKNDTLGELVNRMELFALPLLFEKGIERVFAIRLSNRQVIIPPNIRANMYLLFKEAVNNVIKHSGCTQCSMCFIQKGNQIRLIVKDNGKGFNIKNTGQHRNGMHIMTERVKDLKGRLTINSLPGVGTEIKIDCKF